MLDTRECYLLAYGLLPCVSLSSNSRKAARSWNRWIVVMMAMVVMAAAVLVLVLFAVPAALSFQGPAAHAKRDERI